MATDQPSICWKCNALTETREKDGYTVVACPRWFDGNDACAVVGLLVPLAEQPDVGFDYSADGAYFNKINVRLRELWPCCEHRWRGFATRNGDMTTGDLQWGYEWMCLFCQKSVKQSRDNPPQGLIEARE